MILAIDTSALVFRYLSGEHRELVLEEMEKIHVWSASELVRVEVMTTLHRASISPAQNIQLSRQFNADWDSFHVIPLDGRCISHASQLGSRFGLRLVDALHFAAIDRLPRPVKYLTLDHRQIPAAVELGFELLTPLE